MSVITPSDIFTLKTSVGIGSAEFTVQDVVNAIFLQMDVVGEAIFDRYDVQLWLGLVEPAFSSD
jgi:hypothetical protein